MQPGEQSVSKLLNHVQDFPMSERKIEILQIAIKIIADSGYGSLTMRQLARESGIKLGALQYHFRTREIMLRSLVNYISIEYRKTFSSVFANNDSLSINELITFLKTEPAGGLFQEDRLWPQLWAMMLVEPLVADLVDEIYKEYIQILEKSLHLSGSKAPRAEALMVMAMVEGSTILIGRNRPWSDENENVFESVKDFIESRYSPNKNIS
jgi:AcrR family transcriptional regulator